MSEAIGNIIRVIGIEFECFNTEFQDFQWLLFPIFIFYEI